MKSKTLIRICNTIIAENKANPGVVTAKLRRKYIRLCNDYKGSQLYGKLKSQTFKARGLKVTAARTENNG